MRRPLRVVALLLTLVCLLQLGCASQNWVTVRTVPRNPLADQLGLTSREGPQQTPRTQQFLRRYDLLAAQAANDPKQLLTQVKQVLDREPTPDNFYAFSELAYVGAVKLESQKNTQAALDLYGCSVAHTYQYLFDPRLGKARNPYDPEFRRACDLYNGALESALRIVRTKGDLKPGATHTIESAGQTWDITVVVRSGVWPARDFDRVEFVSDYEISGLTNQYHSYGLGVPLIVNRKKHPRDEPGEKYYPQGLSFPMTAFLRLVPDDPSHGPNCTKHKALLELYDPMVSSDVVVDNRRVPLETDLSTALAYFLNDPLFAKLDQSTTGLLFPDSKETQELAGLYMLEPYQPQKIPVLMIHGLWSSPITWMEMFNDLRANADLRQTHQFWFYLYPTGQPFWYSAAQLRMALHQMRQTHDPQGHHPAIDQMVLVGHSMGGLVAKMQTIESGDAFWQQVASKPFADLKTEEQTRRELTQTFFFRPNLSVKQVITIGTPHRGSDFSNDYTQWLGRKLISLPQMLVQKNQRLKSDNPGFFPAGTLLDVSNSIDSLSPKSPILPLILNSPHAPWTEYHNIVGRLPRNAWTSKLLADGDGVVPYTSAHLDGVASEIVVDSDHSNLHRHPRSVLEVRRILLEHLSKLRMACRPTDPPLGGGVVSAELQAQDPVLAAQAGFIAPPAAAAQPLPVLQPAAAGTPPSTAPSVYPAPAIVPQPAAATPANPAVLSWPMSEPVAP